MRRYSLYTLLFGTLAFLGLTVSVILYFSISQERNRLIETAVSEKINLAETINETIFSSAWKFRVSAIPGIENLLIGQIAKAKDIVFIKVIGLDGIVRLSSLERDVGETIKDADIQKAATSQKAVIKDAFFGEKEIKLIIYPTQSDNAIWLGFSLQNVKDAIVRTTVQSIAVGVGSLFFILLVLFFVFRSIINPIKKIITVCREISKGNLNIIVNAESKTEIGELVQTFNQTIENLRKSKEDLEEAKTVLEVKVKARTFEFQNLNANLEKEISVRTQEVQEKMKELERFNKLAVGRELKMISLKEELKKMKAEYGE